MNDRLLLLGRELGVAIISAIYKDNAVQMVERMDSQALPLPAHTRRPILLLLGRIAHASLQACGFDVVQRSWRDGRERGDRWQDVTVW